MVRLLAAVAVVGLVVLLVLNWRVAWLEGRGAAGKETVVAAGNGSGEATVGAEVDDGPSEALDLIDTGGPPVGVDVEIFQRVDGERVVVPYSSRDAVVAATLTALLVKAERVPDHKCANKGRIVIRWEGRTEEIGILSGHDAESYEFRFRGGCFRVPRDRFAVAMAGVGVPDLP